MVGIDLTIEQIRAALTYPAQNQAPRPAFREMPHMDPDSAICAAVLMPLVRYPPGQWSLVYTRRTDLVHSHKGQVSFPGGACEPQDHDLEATALREAYEEIGLRPEEVHVLGRLEGMLVLTGFQVTPVLGAIPWPYNFTLSPMEVSRVFTVPVAWLADPQNYEERPFHYPSRNVTGQVVYYKPYQGEVVWGATARMTHILLQRLGLLPGDPDAYLAP